ncbi:MAG TPA: hypothetical protein VLR94_10105, partial [Acidobacteriota bacterium]|nr:hypothetical protein [Acidobacteriota bacterium]
DGGMLVSSSTDLPDGRTVAVVTRFTAVGGILWSRSYSSSYNFHSGAAVQEAADGTLYFLQYVAPSINVNSRSVLSHLSSTGNVLWSRMIRQGTVSLAIFSAVAAPDGGVVLAGTAGSSTTRGVILELDPVGKLLWSKALQIAGSSVAINSVSLSFTGDSLLIAACVFPNTTTDVDAALLQLSIHGNLDGGCGALPLAPLAASAFSVAIASNSFTQPAVTYSTSLPAVSTSGVTLISGRVCASQ